MQLIQEGFVEKAFVVRDSMEKELFQLAMRRAGANPTDVEVTDIINKIDNDTGALDFQV